MTPACPMVPNLDIHKKTTSTKAVRNPFNVLIGVLGVMNLAVEFAGKIDLVKDRFKEIFGSIRY